MSEVGFEPMYFYMTVQCLIHLAITQYDSNRSVKYINIADAERNPNGKATMSPFTKVHNKIILFFYNTASILFYVYISIRTESTSSCNRKCKNTRQVAHVSKRNATKLTLC